ncbi:hypothetical protein G6F56_009134 [Rhizopus delemar]|nr:hypothetical protein G6F56_009134 [Rhizopus delemar]
MSGNNNNTTPQAAEMLSTEFSRFVLIENLKQLQMRTFDTKKDSLPQFGIPEDEENRHLVTQLRQCKQQRNETVQLFNARRHHIVSLLPDGHLKSYQFIQIYTQALRHEGLRTILIAFIE